VFVNALCKPYGFAACYGDSLVAYGTFLKCNLSPQK